MKIKMHLTVEKERLEMIEKMAKKLGINRTAFINLAISEYMKGRLNG